VWVELVSGVARVVSICIWLKLEYEEGQMKLSDRANKETSVGGGIHSPIPRVIGNVKIVIIMKCVMAGLPHGKKNTTYSLRRARFA